MKQKIELLAPAGSYDSFLAAVENGADAVYLGGKLFNARANASNFDIDELRKIVEYAHLRGVKIHLTLNTLLDDKDLEEALSFAYDIYEIGVDAVIVQDLGLAKLLHTAIPDLVLHASTQISAYNLDGVKALAQLGFSRVVLARELSLDEIRYICENTETEIEIFAHGALCVSYSGQCLMSSMIGDRSGNRGKCAQPCRMPYKLIKNDKTVASGYLLSPKDLSTLDILPNLPNISCLKIEGRMKSPEYVATVVSIYRKYLDSMYSGSAQVPTSEDKANLAQVFNRGGFSKAYLNGKTGKDMMCYEKPKNWGIYLGKVTNYDSKRYISLDNHSSLKIGDGIEVWNGDNTSPSTIVSEIVGNKIGRISGNIHIGDKVYKTSDKALNQRAKESYSRNATRRMPIDVAICLEENIPVKVYISKSIDSNKSAFCYTSEHTPIKAQNQPLTKESIFACFQKTGNTPFIVQNFSVNMSDDLFLPISALNDIRRKALEAFETKLLSNSIKKIERKPFQYFNDVLNGVNTNQDNSIGNSKKISAYFTFLKEEFQNLKNVDAFYFSFKEAITNLDIIEKFHGNKYIVLPTITKSNYHTLLVKHIPLLASKVNGFVLSHIGQLEFFKNISTELIANYTFNTFNTFSVKLLETLGFSKVILSPELTKSQINNIVSGTQKDNAHMHTNLEVLAYGNLCTMTSEYCPIGSIVGGLTSTHKCTKPCLKKDVYYLKDRVQLDFRVIPDSIDCQSNIYNAKTTSIESKDLLVDSIRLDFIDETFDEIQQIIDIHKKGNKMSGDKYTNGHINRPV